MPLNPPPTNYAPVTLAFLEDVAASTYVPSTGLFTNAAGASVACHTFSGSAWSLVPSGGYPISAPSAALLVGATVALGGDFVAATGAAYWLVLTRDTVVAVAAT